MKSSGINKSELVAAGLLIALGVAIMWQAKSWVYLTKDGPGPGFFPMWTGGSIIVLAAVVALRHIYDVFKRQLVDKANWNGASRVLLAWAGLAISIVLLEPLGFVVSFLLLTLFYVMVIYRKSLIAALSVGVSAALGFWVLFVVLLQVQLPAGPWGF